MILKKNEKGFTLVELMIVIVIIAIILAIAIPEYIHTITNAELRTCQANVRIINGAVVQYFMANGVYPSELSDLVNPSYIQSMPHCPVAGADVDYIYDPATGTVSCTIPTHN
jgi:prepilin-type N-terminal cleavage/methylation domain-containing protein